MNRLVLLDQPRHNFHVEFLLQVRKHDKVCDLELERDGTESLALNVSVSLTVMNILLRSRR